MTKDTARYTGTVLYCKVVHGTAYRLGADCQDNVIQFVPCTVLYSTYGKTMSIASFILLKLIILAVMYRTYGYCRHSVLVSAEVRKKGTVLYVAAPEIYGT